MVSNDKSNILIAFSIWVRRYFSLAGFKIFLSLVFQSLIRICLSLGYPVWGLLSFLNLCIYVSAKFVEFSAIIFPGLFSLPSLYSLSGTPWHNVRSFVLVSQVSFNWLLKFQYKIQSTKDFFHSRLDLKALQVMIR